FMERDRLVSEARCDDSSALGEEGRYAGPPASARQDRFGLCLTGGVGCMDGWPHSSNGAGEWQTCLTFRIRGRAAPSGALHLSFRIEICPASRNDRDGR